MDELDGPSAEDLKSWYAKVDGRIKSIEEEIESLHRELAPLRERQKLLSGLLVSLGADPPGDPIDTSANRASYSRSSTSADPARKETVRERVHREVVAVLTDVGRPLHINKLLDEYKKRGYEPPGQGRPANISVHLTGWDDIENPERGFYGLKE